jgi:hypothetical protein
VSGGSAWVDLRARVPGLRGHRVHVFPSSREAELRAALAAAGFAAVTLAGSAIRNEATFFAEAARALALPGWFGHGWDALADALRDPDRAGGPREAILWVEAEQSLAADLQLFVGALLAFDAAARDLASEGDGDHPRQLEVFVFGRGTGFAD